MIYSKSAISLYYLNPNFNIKNLSKFDGRNGSVFWYDQYDQSKRGLLLSNFIDDEHWQHLKKDPTSKILLYYGNEYFNAVDIEYWSAAIQSRNINTNQIYIITIDENWKKWTIEKFAKKGIYHINIQALNELLIKANIDFDYHENTTNYKFSMLSRNYGKWRLRLYSTIINEQLLSNFNYSFNNTNPYVNLGEFTKEDMLEDLKLLGDVSHEVDQWLNTLPVNLPSTAEDPMNKWIIETYDAIMNSDIHILIESHYDPYFNFYPTGIEYPIKDYSPAFPTEKTYKVLSCKRPFVAFTTPYFLEELRVLGYRTFHPYINESYDKIEDNTQRLFAITEEIKRLSKMDSREFSNVLKCCREICEHNYNVLLSNKEKSIFQENFKWLLPHLSAFQVISKRKT